MKRVGASAPGKALLSGEYAVLEGAPAVVAAVDRRVWVDWSDEPKCAPPEVDATLAEAHIVCGRVDGFVSIDVRELHEDGTKLGLGSSAAGAAATAAAVFASQGHDIDDPEVKSRVFECAMQGHAVIAPEGSGVDVAASTWGGFLRFRRHAAHVDAAPIHAPEDLSLRLVWTGHAVRTSELLERVDALHRDAPNRYRDCIEKLGDLACEFSAAFDRGNTSDVVGLAAAYGQAMAALGEASGAPIVESRLALASEIATRFSGSAKPCGAGGGDVAVAFFSDSEAADGFVLACRERGLHPIDVSWGASGVRARDGGGR